MPEVIAIMISVTKGFDEGDGTTWQTTVPQTASSEEINSVIDKIHKSIFRQAKWQRLDRASKELEHSGKQKAQLQYSLLSIENKYKNQSIPKDALSAIEQTRDNILRFDTQLENLLHEIESLKQELI